MKKSDKFVWKQDDVKYEPPKTRSRSPQKSGQIKGTDLVRVMGGKK